ncbi:hypothetical protein HEP75_00552 [Xanthomonas sp. SI]|nr:hypothetical protein HEP75_00552 [Xanthomonas sp. SI]
MRKRMVDADAFGAACAALRDAPIRDMCFACIGVQVRQ